MHDHFHERVSNSWSKFVVIERNTLMANLVNALKKPKFRLEAVAFFAEVHGASGALDVVDQLDRVWSLRY